MRDKTHSSICSIHGPYINFCDHCQDEWVAEHPEEMVKVRRKMMKIVDAPLLNGENDEQANS